MSTEPSLTVYAHLPDAGVEPVTVTMTVELAKM